MLLEVIEYLQTTIDALSLFANVKTDALPAVGNGLSLQVGAGSPDETYLDKGSTNTLFFLLNGKHTNQATLISDLDKAHLTLSRMKTYGQGDDWQILNIESSTTPRQIGKGSNGEWLYGSILRVTIYIKGE